MSTSSVVEQQVPRAAEELAEERIAYLDAGTISDFKTAVGTIMGTASNMSPEQVLATDVDVRSDIFSLGVVLYEMATGLMPFDAGNATATLLAIMRKEPTPVAQVNPMVPPDLARLIHQCLAKDRAFRPSAPHLKEDLKKIEATLKVGAPVRSGIRLASDQAGAGVPLPAQPPARPPAPAPVVAVAAAPAVVPSPVVEKPAPISASAPSGSTANKQLYRAIHFTRLAVSWGTMVWPLGFVLYFLILGGVIHSQGLEGTGVMAFLRATVVPEASWLRSIIPIHLTFQKWNFLVLGLGPAAFFARFLAVAPLETAERWARLKQAPH